MGKDLRFSLVTVYATIAGILILGSLGEQISNNLLGLLICSNSLFTLIGFSASVKLGRRT